MRKPFKGVTNLDIRDSEPDWDHQARTWRDRP
jgi:hypothetical protein